MQQSGNCIRLWAADCLSSASVIHNGATPIGKPSHQLPLVSKNLRRFTSGIEVQVLRWSPCGKRLFAAFESVFCARVSLRLFGHDPIVHASPYLGIFDESNIFFRKSCRYLKRGTALAIILSFILFASTLCLNSNKYVQIWETLTWTTEYAGLQAGSCTAAGQSFYGTTHNCIGKFSCAYVSVDTGRASAVCGIFPC